MEKAKHLEADLYPPIKNFLLQNGYTVRSEVADCDVAALRGDELTVVELKLRLNLDVILQACDRQRVADRVYIAVPRPKKYPPRYKSLLTLLRRLEIGLLEVTLSARVTRVHEVLQPVLLDMALAKARAKKRRARMEQEIIRRSDDYNIGGTTRRKQLTAYREEAVALALHLYECGPMRAAAAKNALDIPKAYRIMYQNYYGWFCRQEDGCYAVTEKGVKEAQTFAQTMAAAANPDE